MTEAAIAVVLYLVSIFVVLAVLRKMNGPDTDADDAADSVRQALDSDDRLDELRDYARPHMRAGSAWGKEVAK